MYFHFQFKNVCQLRNAFFTISTQEPGMTTFGRPAMSARQPYNQWYADVTELKSQLESRPDDLKLAKRFWEAISGTAGYDVRNGKRVIDTFRRCALQTDVGLAELVSAFRKLAADSGEYPRAALFDPSLKNLLRSISRKPNHALFDDVNWILKFIDSK
jgi:hypothetical protein